MAINNKKGIFFSLIAILIIGTAFFYLALSQDIPQKQDIEINELRIGKINDYVTNLEESYIPQIITNLGYIKAKEIDYNMANGIPWGGNPTTLIKTHINTAKQTHLTKLETVTDTFLDIQFDPANQLTVIISDVTYHDQENSLQIEAILDYKVQTDFATWTRSNIIIQPKFSIADLSDLRTYLDLNP